MLSGNCLRGNRTAASVLTATTIAVAIILIAAAAYFVLSDDKEDKSYMTCGTTMSYTINGDILGLPITGAMDVEIIGESSEEYFAEFNIEITRLGVTESSVYYWMSNKESGAPASAIREGSVKIDTIDGTMDLDVWKYVMDGMNIRSYIDPISGFEYKVDIFSEIGAVDITAEMVEKDPKWSNGTYSRSDSIGVRHSYLVTKADDTWADGFVIECVADCEDGFGISYLIRSGSNTILEYDVSKNPQGLPEKSEYAHQTTILQDTIDGNVLVQVWILEGYENGGYARFYCDPVSNIVYQIEMVGGNTGFATATLTSKG